MEWIAQFELEFPDEEIEDRAQFLDTRKFLLKLQQHFFQFGMKMSQQQLEDYWDETDSDNHGASNGSNNKRSHDEIANENDGPGPNTGSRKKNKNGSGKQESQTQDYGVYYRARFNQAMAAWEHNHDQNNVEFAYIGGVRAF